MPTNAMLRLPLLFYMMGYPGSGKTTFATTFSQRNKVKHLHADRLGFELYRQPTFSPEERQVIMREMNRRAYDLLIMGKSVIYDAGINTVAERERLRRLAQKANTAAVGVWVSTPQDISFKRLSNPRLIMDIKVVFDSNNAKGKAAFARALQKFEEPSDNEPYIVEISGLDGYDAQRDDVLSHIFPKK